MRERDPFSGKHVFGVLDRYSTPIVGRLRSMWEAMRGEVLAVFPDAPGLPRETSAYLHSVDDLYQSDAYHSLSIEGYNVNPALIQRVQQGNNWNPQANNEDRQSRDALAVGGSEGVPARWAGRSGAGRRAHDLHLVFLSSCPIHLEHTATGVKVCYSLPLDRQS